MGISCFQTTKLKIGNPTGTSNKITGDLVRNRTTDGNKGESERRMRSKDGETSGTHSKSSKNLMSYNNINNDNAKNQNPQKKNEVNNNKDSQKENSYSTLTLGKKYYLVCPDCKKSIPNIKNFEYDKNENDFKISYKCDCTKTDNILKKNLIKFYYTKKPKNNNYIPEEIIDKMYKIAQENEKNFKGFEIFDKYRNDLIMNRTIPPNPLFNNPSIISKNISTNVKISENQNIQHHVEISGNYELDNNNIPLDKTKSKYISTMMPIEEENKSMKKYKCTKTWKGHTNKILSLIELNSESEFIVTGSWDKKIIVWKIADEPVIFKNLETNGIIKCLLEFEKNIILFGNGNNIGLWNLALADNKYSFNFSGHKKEVNCLAKCNHNYFASCSDDQTIIIWDYHGKNKFRTIEAHNGKILCLIKLKNGNLCSGGDDLSIKYWDWERGECVGTIPNAHDKMISCLLEKENEDLLSGSYDTTIKLWKGDVILRNIDSHEDTIAALCQIDNIYIASGSFDKNIKIWNINNLECFQSLSGHNDKISCLIKLKNNNSLVSCSYDGIIKIWEND